MNPSLIIPPAPHLAPHLAPPVNLTRVRAGVRAVLALGVAASISANVLHAQHNTVGRAIAAWSPLALLLTVELISRVPVTGRGLSRIRMTATAAIAGIAAWVSYWHMVSVATRYGEAATSAHLLPLSVDGLVIVASVSLVEIAARLRATPATYAIPAAAGPVTGIAEDDAPAPAAEPAGAVPVPADPEPVTDPASEPAAATSAPGKPTVKKTAPAGTAVKIGRLRDRHPEWTVAQIAERAGVTDRTVRRHLNATTPPVTTSPATSPVSASADLAA